MKYNHLLIKGPMGSGKTTLSLDLFRKLRDLEKKVSYFSFDKLYLSYFSSMFKETLMIEAAELLALNVNTMKHKGYFSIIEGIFIKPVYESFNESLEGSMLNVNLQVPLEICLEGNNQREGLKKLND
jgi:Cdc6-like AAA superfamily ATPase